MSNKGNLILPWLPENLEALHKQEGENRTRSVLHINADKSSKDHLEIVYASLNTLFELTISYQNQTDDELTIQALGIRLFNSIVSSLELLLAGYYQCSVMLQRDVLETGFLLDFLSIDESNISAWARCTREERLEKYSPRKIRQALDERDGFRKEQRKEAYQSMCENASHATYQGNVLIAPDKLVRIGPFFDPKYLRFLVQELAMRAPYFALICSGHFRQLPTLFSDVRADFVVKLKIWSERYMKISFGGIGTDQIEQCIETLSQGFFGD